MKMLVTKLSHGKYANEGQLFAEIISADNVKLRKWAKIWTNKTTF